MGLGLSIFILVTLAVVGFGFVLYVEIGGGGGIARYLLIPVAFGIVAVLCRIYWLNFWLSLLLGVIIAIVVGAIIARYDDRDYYKNKKKEKESKKYLEEKKDITIRELIEKTDAENSINELDYYLSLFTKEKFQSNNYLEGKQDFIVYRFDGMSLNYNEYEMLINRIKNRKQQLIYKMNQRDIDQENASKNIKNLLEDI